MTDLEQLRESLRSLVLFRQLLENPVLKKLIALLDCICESSSEPESRLAMISAYSDFVSELFRRTTSLTGYLLTVILEDENLYMISRAQNLPIPETIEKSLDYELGLLEQVSAVSGEELVRLIGFSGYLPVWETERKDFRAIYEERMNSIPLHGYGIFAKYHVFLMREDKLVPVEHPDPTQLEALNGYEAERQAVVDNTLALLHGRPAANVLLYGDAGTGKSATVKAVANQFRDQGLRLIELQKNQLRQIPRLLDLLSKNPLKFILFIDDLSFTQNDDDFAALKAILEGSVAARALNLVVYATSNRRHLIKESFSDREGNDIHLSDTLQELTSLSERFGLTITFSKPNKQLYLSIVHTLAEQYGISVEPEVLDKKAEAYALGRGGRSPRVAKQFVEYLSAAGEVPCGAK